MYTFFFTIFFIYLNLNKQYVWNIIDPVYEYSIEQPVMTREYKIHSLIFSINGYQRSLSVVEIGLAALPTERYKRNVIRGTLDLVG